MKKFLIILEKTNTGYSSYSPDLPGCVATGSSLEETEKNMREAIQFHIEGLREDGLEVPDSQTRAEYIAVPG